MFIDAFFMLLWIYVLHQNDREGMVTDTRVFNDAVIKFRTLKKATVVMVTTDFLKFYCGYVLIKTLKII